MYKMLLEKAFIMYYYSVIIHFLRYDSYQKHPTETESSG